ncbi:MAG TPA: biotin-dependent carboxyltransferase family protein [Chthoniobacterales bacterium]|nr:biotin-dependent carboxyltransferase family protein [Chthoniobacterales bacterium]
MTATILRSGFLSSVQDLGRVGYRTSGVTRGGALDGHALRVANLLVGNAAAAAGIELTLGRLQMNCEDERVVAWTGGSFMVRVGGAEVPAGRPVALGRGVELIAEAPEKGSRAWIALSGGIDVPTILRSRSTDLRSGFGGHHGRPLRDGDVLPLGPSSAAASRIISQIDQGGIAGWSAPREWAITTPRHPFLRIVRGADWKLFAEAALSALANETFTVTADSDRMGVRLEGPMLERLTMNDLVSEAVMPGTIQVPPNGQPILLLGDCQTLGGYPKIAHVITVDLPLAAQLGSGATVRFAEISLPEAQRLYLEREGDLERLRIGLSLKTS